jgi:protein TonB
MRSALGISFTLHLLISLIAFNWVSFREVKYVPRQVYNVTLVTPQVQAQPVVQPPPPQPEPELEPEPEPEPEEEMPPPPEKPKSKPKPKPKPRKTVPTTQVEKTQPDPEQTEPVEPPPETGDVTLDTEDFPFSHYISRMRRKIAANWRVPEGSQGADRFCRIYFRVHRDGSVSNVDVEESSGLFMFDQSAQRAVVQAAPMPPLPREYRDNYLGVHFSFAFREKR